MTRKIEITVVWDYGGVFTNGRRWDRLVDLLSEGRTEIRGVLVTIARDGLLRKLANGSLDQQSFLHELQGTYGVDAKSFQATAKFVSEPVPEMVELTKNLQRMGARQIMISDNIPFYTESITSALSGVIETFHFSDSYGLRKADGLLEAVLTKYTKECAKAGVYIDDNPRFCVRAKAACPGLEVVQFTDAASCQNRIWTWIADSV